MSGVETRKTVTILFCDVTGSTELGERLDPEALRGVMLRYFDVARDTLEQHGGTVEKFIGDAVMAVFGVPTVHEDDALRAVRAATDLRSRVAALADELKQTWGVRLEVRIGVNTGEVVAGEGGTLVTGDAVNVAARLEQTAAPNEIVLGRATHRLVAHAVTAVPAAALALKGKAAPVEAWLVQGVAADAPTLAARPDSPLVGRRWELGFLHEVLAQVASERRCELVTVVATAGVGKSRLAQEFCSRLTGATAATGRCLAYGDGITFWPIRDIVRGLAGVSPGDGGAAARQRILGLVEREPEAALVCDRVAEAIGLGEGTAATPEVFWGLRRLFEVVAAERPLVLVFEDIHWAEPTLLDLLESILQWSARSPIMLLCLARPELLDVRPSWAEGTPTIALDALGERESRELIANLFDRAVAEPTIDRVAAAAEGNPLFVEELVAMLVEDGSYDADRLEVPPTIQALLTARLDRLGPLERAVVGRAAVLGKQFRWSAIEALVPDELRPAVPSTLSALVRKKLIRPDTSGAVADENAFRFGHILVRDAAYAALPKQLRAELHERYASWLEQSAGERLSEYDEILGYHLEQAYRARTELGPPDGRALQLARRACEFLGAAGRRAFVRDDTPAAVNLLDRALALATDEDPARLELTRELSVALWSLGEVARAESLLDGVIATAGATQDRRHEAYARLERAARATLTGVSSDTDEQLRVACEAIRTFEEADDARGLARAWREVASVQRARCRFAAAAEASDHALAYARRQGEAREEARAIDALCTSLLYGPAPAGEAARRCLEMLADSRDNPLVDANVRAALVGLEAMRGRFDEARAHAGRAEEVYGRLGLRLAVAGLLQVVGDAELLAGDPAAAELALRRSYEILEGIGATGFTAVLLGETVYAQGRLDEAAELLAVGRERAGRDLATQIRLSALGARLRAHRGDAGAFEQAREAVALSESTDALNLQADALVALADVLHLLNRGDEGTAAGARALAAYEAKGNAAAALRLQAALRTATPMP